MKSKRLKPGTPLRAEILKGLASTVTENEEAQRRFRIAVLIRLSNIETTVNMIHGAQIAAAHDLKPAREKSMKEHAQAAQGYISDHSKELCLKMVRFVYEGLEALGAGAETRQDRRRKWSGWEI
jgi:hypothetical protein